MAKRRAPNMSFLQLSPNNRRAKVARLLGWKPNALLPAQRECVDRIICHAAQVADETMRQHVNTLRALMAAD